MKAHITNQKGFTLIELLVTISIISMLSSVAYAGYGAVKAKARDAKRAEDAVQLRTALALYEVDHGGVPAGTAAAGCTGSPDNNNPTTWTCSSSASLNAILTPLVTGKYISSLPTDPINSAGVTYYYSTGTGVTTDPVSGVSIAKNASFDYVSESLTSSPSTPVVLGTNVGTPDYATYPNTGYPVDSATISTGVNTNVPPNPPTSLTASASVGGSVLGVNDSNQTANAGLAFSFPIHVVPTAPILLANVTWTAPTNAPVTGYIVNRTIVQSGGSFGNMVPTTPYTTGGTGISENGVPAGYSNPFVETDSVVAYNNYGTSSAANITISFPEITLYPTLGCVQSHIAGAQPSCSLFIQPSVSVPGAVYTIRYSTDVNNTTGTVLGTVTMGSDGTGVFSVDPSLSGAVSWRADLHSLPTFTGN